MKKSIFYIVAASALLFSSCDDLLDKNPRDTFVNNPAFWSNNNQVESYSNGFYEFYGGASNFYFNALNDDQVEPTFANWSFTTVPAKSGAWSGRFTNIRRINYMLDGLKTSTLPAAQRKRYEAIGRLNRAYEYAELTKMYGDVQWENKAITDLNDEAVYGERTDQDVVMDSVLNDLNFAIDNLESNTSDKTLWSKELALAIKSDACLYWGTYCKYRTQADNGKAADLTLANKFLQECVNASEQLMNSGKFSLDPWTVAGGKTYTIFNSINIGNNPEVIFYRNYEKDLVMQPSSLADYTSGSTTQKGITKDAIDAFLFLDGKPKATTSLPKDDKAVLDANGNYSIAHFLARKDKRLSLLVDPILAFKDHGWIRNEPSPDGPLPAEMTSSTGYTIYKFDNPQLPLHYRTNTNTSYMDVPMYWYATILLNEAEAKAELGTITQTDLDKTINLLQARAGLPNMTTTPATDPANNAGVGDLIWEIRRCRRCELILANDYRYWDLVRWHQLDKLDSNTYPNINLGANVTNVSDADKNAQGYLNGTSATRKFEAKYYHYPVPANEIKLVKDQGKVLTQNPGW